MTEKWSQLFFSVPFDQSFAAPLGCIFIGWGQLEHEYHDFIATMMKRSKTVASEDWRYRRPRQIAALYRDQVALCFSEQDRLVAELHSIREGMDLLQIDRNLLAHGHMVLVSTPPNGSLEVSGRYNRADYVRRYALPELQKLYSAIASLHGRLWLFNCGAVLEPLQAGWTPQELSFLRDFHSDNPRSFPILEKH